MGRAWGLGVRVLGFIRDEELGFKNCGVQGLGVEDHPDSFKGSLKGGSLKKGGVSFEGLFLEGLLQGIF